VAASSELAEIENEVFKLQHSIATTQEIMQLNLARSRNRLQTLNLFTAIGASRKPLSRKTPTPTKQMNANKAVLSRLC
jgi:hypothetical protein